MIIDEQLRRYEKMNKNYLLEEFDKHDIIASYYFNDINSAMNAAADISREGGYYMIWRLEESLIYNETYKDE